jgi:ABC-type nitrate/sulfonate/bicarbonate transport system permease component
MQESTYLKGIASVSRGLVTPFDRIDKKVFIFTILFEWFLIFTIWQINGGALIPKPLGIVEKLGQILTSDDFYMNLLTSLILTLQAIFFATLIALVFAYSYKIGLLRPLVEFMIVLRYLPLTGVIFVFTFITHGGSNLKLVLLLFGIVPFFVTSMVAAIEEINPQLYDLCKSLRMTRWQTLWRVVVMGRLDYVFEVMRQNFAICWLMITMVEGLSMSEGGIGTMLIKQNKTLELEFVFAIQTTLFILGISFDFLLRKIRYRLFKHVPLMLNR